VTNDLFVITENNFKILQTYMRLYPKVSGLSRWWNIRLQQ